MSNVGDVKVVKARNRRERRENERRLNGIRVIWGTPEGRHYLWSIMDFAGFLRTSMTGNSTTFFNEGARNVALRMFADVEEACPEMFLLARDEAKKHQKRENDSELALDSTPEKEDDHG